MWMVFALAVPVLVAWNVLDIVQVQRATTKESDVLDTVAATMMENALAILDMPAQIVLDELVPINVPTVDCVQAKENVFVSKDSKEPIAMSEDHRFR